MEENFGNDVQMDKISFTQVNRDNPYMEASETVDVPITVMEQKVNPYVAQQPVNNGMYQQGNYGMPVGNSLGNGTQQPNMNYQQGTMQENGYGMQPGNNLYMQPNYTEGYMPPFEDELSVGQWVLTIFLTALPIAGLVMLFIWGFGNGNKARANYAKAMLIMVAIGIGISILGSLLFTYACFNSFSAIF